MTRRFVPGLRLDDYVLAYEGSGVSDRRYMMADERGSVVAYTDGSTGGLLSINTYDEYGVPGAGNAGRFQYTGQMWLPDAGVYHYRARAYAPQIGRFLQTDPIGYAAGANLYAYVGGDPVNLADPLGLQECETTATVQCAPETTISGSRGRNDVLWGYGGPGVFATGFGAIAGGFGSSNVNNGINLIDEISQLADILVTGPRDPPASPPPNISIVIGAVTVRASGTFGFIDGQVSFPWPFIVLNQGNSENAVTPRRETTPTTNRRAFRNVPRSPGLENLRTGEVWALDRLHKDHYEVYRDRRAYQAGDRSRDVWLDGRLKGVF